jgi:hypothetical protein
MGYLKAPGRRSPDKAPGFFYRYLFRGIPVKKIRGLYPGTRIFYWYFFRVHGFFTGIFYRYFTGIFTGIFLQFEAVPDQIKLKRSILVPTI